MRITNAADEAQAFRDAGTGLKLESARCIVLIGGLECERRPRIEVGDKAILDIVVKHAPVELQAVIEQARFHTGFIGPACRGGVWIG